LTTQAAAQKTILQHIRIAASAERVYNALTQASELKRWFPPRAESDPRVGGAFRYEFDLPGGLHPIEGKYLALVPHTLVKYSWHEFLDDDDTLLTNLTVTFRLEAHGDHTDVFLEETGFGADTLHETLFGRRQNGWSFFCGNLKSVLEGGPDERDE
jgi:uncharacterized protein YndB with AHSA1/START domain